MLVSMRALYPKPALLPSLLLLLSACEWQDAEPRPARVQEPWSNEQEALFQEAEALKYALQQHRLDEQRLREAGLPVNPPAPLK